MYYPCSENKGADQLRGYREADLRLCFRICRLLVFPRGGSFIFNITVCVFSDSGILMTCGWNNYGQLGHGDTDCRDYLETVQYFIDRGETVTDVKAECWNTAVFVGTKM